MEFWRREKAAAAWAVRRRATADQVRREIDHGRPLCVRIKWFDGGTHFVTIYGYVNNKKSELDKVNVADPIYYPTGTKITWDEFQKRYVTPGNIGTWTDSYYTKGGEHDD